MDYKYARNWFEYRDGQLLWARAKPGVRRGAVAGFTMGGSRYVIVDGERLLVKNIIWTLVTGKWPTSTLYHRNGNRLDCRYENLTQDRAERQLDHRVAFERLEDGTCVATYGGQEIARGDADEVLATVRAMLVY